MIRRFIIGTVISLSTLSGQAQGTHAVTDPELALKTAKDFFLNQQYAIAYPLFGELLEVYPENTVSSNTYQVEDVRYYYLVCRLKLLHEAAAHQAETYIESTPNQPRRQLMSFHLAHYYYQTQNFEKAVTYFEKAGFDNLSNDQVADAKFEMAYAYFSLGQYAQAKPLFEEIRQIPEHKFYIPANYYYGFIAYRDKEYAKALKAFQLVETTEPYQGMVPYYIAEIYYFQGKKQEAMNYGSAVLERGGQIYHEKELKLLIAHLYFEDKNWSKALPLFEDYVNSSDAVSREVMYSLSFSQYMMGDYANAIQGFKQLSNEKDSMSQNSMYILGDLYLKSGDKASARNAFQFSANNSSHAEQQRISKFQYAKLSYDLGYLDIALNEIRSYLDRYPGTEFDAEAKSILIDILANTSNYREALGIYRSMDKPTDRMKQSYPKVIYGRAIELLNDQQLAQADALLSEVLANGYSGSLKSYASFWKGEIALRYQRYDDAIRFTNQFVESNVPAQGEANREAAYYNLGYSYLYKENYKSAQQQFQNIASSLSAANTPLRQDAYIRLADCYYMQRDFSKATSIYQQVIQQHWSAADYAQFLLAMIAGVNSTSQKIQMLEQLTRTSPTSNLVADANYEIAQTYISDEQFRKAIPYLEKLLQSNQESLKPRAYLKLGLVHFNSGNNRDAIKNYATLIEKYPHSEEAAEALDVVKDIYVEENRLDEYWTLLRKAGKNVDATEADNLSYNAAALQFRNRQWQQAANSFTQYLNQYPEGLHVVEALYNRSLSWLELKKNDEALEGFEMVVQKGMSNYYELAALEAGQLYYFEKKDYSKAKNYFLRVRDVSASQDNLLAALRGLVRSLYQEKDYDEANVIAKELLAHKGLSTDDKSIANLVLGKSLQQQGKYKEAIDAFKAVSVINKSAWGAESRFETAVSYFELNDMKNAEKAANLVIKETGSYDYWLTSAYILLGDIFMHDKDYFNAKATYESVAENAVIQELKDKARSKYEQAVAEEKKHSKIAD